jgi:putative ABC transport system permease protein
VLVVLAGLFTKSLANVMGGDPGLKTAGVVMFGLVPARNGYTNPRSAALFDRVEAEIAALPGVSGVSSSTSRILSGQHRVTQGFVEGFDAGLDADRDTQFDEIGSGYFRTLGIQVIAGREFTAADSEGASKVAIVNERFARKFGLGGAAIGKRMSPRTPALDLEIVGIVKDFKQTNVRDAVEAMYFVPHRQGTRRPGEMVFYVRSSPDALRSTFAGIRQVVRGIDPNLPIEEMRTVDETIRGMATGDRVMSVMTTTFGLLALVVAAIGLYGMLAYMVAQRTPEIGVRMTLGATRREVRWMVFRQVTAITVAGGAIGLMVALLVGRLAQRILFGLQFHDAIVILSSLTVLAGVALVAGVVPAHRAASVDPMRALKVD